MGSPPTRRVVALLEALSSTPEPQSASALADQLTLSRATVSAILAELEEAQWVTRAKDLRYRLGPNLPRRARVDPDIHVLDVLDRLVSTVGCGASVSRVTGESLTVIAKRHAADRPLHGFDVGTTMPSHYPVGASVMPWRARADRDRWLRGHERAGGALLRQVRARGYAMFRPREADDDLMEVLVDLLGAVTPRHVSPTLRRQTLGQLGRLTSGTFQDAELDSASPLAISYISAPIFRDGSADHEIQLGVLRTNVSEDERRTYIDHVTAAARALSTD